MARLSPLLLALLLGAASAAALASCGGSDADLLPGTTAEEIESNLDRVDELAAAEDCIGAEDAVATVTEEVEDLEGVDLKLKAALRDGTARLSEVVASCEEGTTSEATEQTFESDVGDEEVEDEKKPKKEKPEKEAPEPKEEPAEDEGPELPPQSNGEGEENGKGGGEEESAEPESGETPPSGGVGPSVGVE